MKEQKSAVIMEIRGKYAAALTRDGSFIRVPNNGYAVGQSIVLPDRMPSRSKSRRLGAVVAMAAGFLLLFLGGWKGYITPAGVVSLDVNPSIEYSINAFDRVLNITAVNDDGGKILEGMDKQALLYRPVEDAIDATIVTLRENGYLAEATENDVMLSASAGNTRHAEALAQRLNALVSRQGDLTVYSVSVTPDEAEHAHTLGTSAGKYYLIEQLEDASGDEKKIDPEDWVGKPVREIIAETKSHPKYEDDEKESPGSTQQPDAKKDSEDGSDKRAEENGGQAEKPRSGAEGGETQEKPSDKGGSGGGNRDERD